MGIEKKYVPVDVSFSIDGEMSPLCIHWEDGRVYQIDKILDKRQAASLKAGGQGMRYTVRIQGQVKYLWYEEPQWFVEAINSN
ncbi:MAG: hypothetical protein FWG30_03680 [Eubacteriaceae bacterium]|nr:hypothetical protein [Eubacteriaceae bacterium]